MKKYIVATITLIFTFCLLMILAFSFGEKSIQKNVRNSFNDYQFYDNMRFGDQIDNYTDMIILNVATYNADAGIIKRAFANEYGYLYDTRYGTNEVDGNMFNNLMASLDHKNDDSIFYGRYWHGSMFFVRLLMTFMNYGQSLVVLLVLGILAVLFSLFMVYKKFDFKVAIIYLVALISSGLMTFATCYQFFFTYIFLIGSIIFLLMKYHEKFDYRLYFFVIGAIASYIIYVSFPIISLSFPLLFILLFKYKNGEYKDYKKNILLVFECSIFWLIGYVLLFATKWVVGTVLTGSDFITNALISINQRLGLTFDFSYYHVLKFNFTRYFSHIYNIIFVVITIVLLIMGLRKNFVNKTKIIFAFILAGLLPFAWMLFTTNHSAIHFWMIYRLISCTLLALMFCTVITWNKNLKLNKIETLNLNDYVLIIASILFVLFFKLKYIYVVVAIVLIIYCIIKKIDFKIWAYVTMLLVFDLVLIFSTFFGKDKLTSDAFMESMYSDLYYRAIRYGEEYKSKHNVPNGTKIKITDMFDNLNADSVFLYACDGYVIIGEEIKPYLNCSNVMVTDGYED